MARKIPSFKTLERACRSGEYVGYCTACGAESYGVEPDAREYECENCGEKQVYGAEELLLMVAF